MPFQPTTYQVFLEVFMRDGRGVTRVYRDLLVDAPTSAEAGKSAELYVRRERNVTEVRVTLVKEW